MSRGGDVYWRYWPGNTFKEEFHATREAIGAQAEVFRKYYPNSFARMSRHQIGRLHDMKLPEEQSSDPTAELMFCDSTILNRENHCVGFTYCVEHKHHTGQRFWFCDKCSKCYHERLSKGKNIHVDETEEEKGEWIVVKKKITK